MSLANFTPAYVKMHPDDFLGPMVTTVIVQAIQLGIIVNQVWRFFARMAAGKKESYYVIGTVVLTIVIMMLQTTLTFANLYRVTVRSFGSWIAVIDVNWMFKVDPLLMGLTAAPVQAFFIRRCWMIMGRKWYILIPLLVLLAANIVALVCITAHVFTLNQAMLILHPDQHLPYYFILFYVFSAVLDLSVTGIMLWYIFIARSIAISKRTIEILSRLTYTIWEAIIPPSICVIIGMSVFLARGDHDFWELFMQGIIGKLYVISLFAVLNGRQATVGPEPTTHVFSSISGTNLQSQKFQSIRFGRGSSRQSDGHIKVNMTTETEIDTDRSEFYETFELKTPSSVTVTRPQSSNEDDAESGIMEK